MAQTKQQKELIALAVLIVAAAALWYVYAHPAQATGSTAGGKSLFKEIDAQDFGQIIINLEKAQGTEYKSAGRNIFVIGPMPAETPSGTPVKVKQPYRPVGPMPPPPPPPPVLPMVFFGYGALPSGGPRQAFLKEKDSDEVHIVSEGELLLNHLRILRIGNERIDFEDINTGLKGSSNLEAPPAT